MTPDRICEFPLGREVPPYFQAGDGILAVRVIALVEAGMLEGRGDLKNMRQSEVRLANQSTGGDGSSRSSMAKKPRPRGKVWARFAEAARQS